MSGISRAAPLVRVGKALSVSVLLAGVAACTTTGNSEKADISTKTKFSEAKYGVAASPRVTDKRTVRLGGGHYQVGQPYEVAGKWYHPKINKHYDKTGVASWYGPNFHGRLTANGEVYDQYALTAANPTLPLPCYARVTNEKTGDSVIVRVNDRGPFAPGRIIDVSSEAARLLHMREAGTAKVKVKFVGMAPLEANDTSYLMASYRPGMDGAPSIDPNTGQNGVMVAMNDAPSAGLPGVTMDDAVPVDRPTPSAVFDQSNASVYAPAVPVAAPAVPVAANAMMPAGTQLSPAQQGIQAALFLPKVGPMPSIRPTLSASAGSVRSPKMAAVTAYASHHAARHAPSPFDDVLAEQQLTPRMIVTAWKHGLVASN